MTKKPEVHDNPGSGRLGLQIGIVIGIIVLAVGIRVHDLGGKALWVDEANSVVIAKQSMPEMVDRLRLDSSPPLYYLLLHAWMRLFGDGVVALRCLSLVAGVALVGGVLHAGRRMFSFETGAIAALLMAVSPVGALYSQQIRMYSLLAFAALLSFYFLWRAIDDKRIRFVIGYGVATLACLYTHNFAFYLLPAHLIILIGTGALRARKATWCICAGCVVAAYLPWLPVFLDQLSNKSHYHWFAGFWDDFGVRGILVRTYDSFSAGRFSWAYAWCGRAEVMSGIRLFLFGAVAVLALIRLMRSWSKKRTTDTNLATLLAFTIVPLIGGLVGSALISPHYVPGRCDQLVLGGFILFAAVGVTVMKPWPLRVAAVLLMVGFSFANLTNLDAPNRKHIGEQAMAEAIANRAHQGDVVICSGLVRAAVEYYLNQEDVPVTVFSYPLDVAKHQGNLDVEALGRQSDAELMEKAQAVLDEVKLICGPENRIFLVLVHHAANRVWHPAQLRARFGIRHIEHIAPFKQAVVQFPCSVEVMEFIDRPALSSPRP